MGLIGEVWADAGLHVNGASFSEYASMLKQAEGQLNGFSDGAKTVVATALTGTAAAITGVAAYGASIASSYEDAILTLKTLYGSQEAAQQKFQWLQQFAASTPFEFPELLDAATQLKAFGMDIEQYGRTIGDTAAAMGKPIDAVVQALADAQQGEFERMKEFGIKAVVLQKDNYQQLGASIQDMGKTALTYMDNNGKQQIAIVDRNNKEMITSTIDAIWNSKYAGAMEERSKSFSGMVSTIKDNLKAGLAEMVGIDMSTGLVESASLLGVLKELAGVALDVSGSFSKMSEPMQTFVVIAALGGAAALALAGGVMAAELAGIGATAVMGALGVAVNTVLWPATLIVGTLALVAAGLIYLEQKTGLVSAAWRTLQDVFTIGAYYAGQVIGWLRDWVVTKIEEIKTSLSEMVPDSWVSGVTTVWNTVTSVVGSAGDSIHNTAVGIEQDHNNIGTSATDTGTQVTGAAGVVASGYDMMGLSSLTAGQNVQTATDQIVSGNTNAGQSALQAGAQTQTATTWMSMGFLQAATDNGIMVNAVKSTVNPVEALKMTISAATSANNTYAASFVDVSNMANAAASAAISAANRIGSAIKTNINQVGELEALAGKWNTRAELGVKSSGGSGTGEGNVKVIDKTGQYAAPVSKSGGRGTGENNVKINTVNNYGSSASATKTKSVV